MRKLFVLLIGLLPFSPVRIFFYRLFFKYKIDYKSYIGWGNYIRCHSLTMQASRIGSFNRIQVNTLVMQQGAVIRLNNNIKLLNRYIMKERSMIISSNTIIGLWKPGNSYKEFCNFELGKDSLITSRHHLDATDMISIGDNVVLGGIGTSVWTHGFDIYRVMIQAPIRIGNDIYIGAGSTICQGVEITDKTVVGAATCISKSIKESGFYVSNQQIRKADIQIYGNREEVQKTPIGMFF